MTTALEDLAMIGDGETVALVSREGSIEWLCLPRFNSAACCAALLGTGEHGYWAISPEGADQEERAALRLRHAGARDGPRPPTRARSGSPISCRSAIDNPTLIRIVEGLEGTVETAFQGRFRFDYGNMPPWITADNGCVIMHVGPDKLVLWGLEDANIDDGSVMRNFTVKKGDRHAFVLTYTAAHERRPIRPMPTRH